MRRARSRSSVVIASRSGAKPLGQQRHQHGLGARKERAAGVDGVARVGRGRGVAGVEERQADVEDALLGAQGRDDLRLRVEVHAEAAV